MAAATARTKDKSRMLVPDTLAGAVLLSLIDFFLSFFVIAGIGFVLAVFPALNALVAVKDRELIED
jgi:hypothetical protein